MKHQNLRITGRVQDVNFRDNTKAFADETGITGFVRNEPDGSVYMEAEGDDNSLHRLLNWLENSPGHSWVSKIDTEQGEIKDYQNFEVRRE